MLIIRRVSPCITRLTLGFIISGGQDKLIYSHKPGDTQPSHILVGHEANVCALDVGSDGTIISGSWDKYKPSLTTLTLVPQEFGRIGHVYILSKDMSEQYGQFWLSKMTNTSQVHHKWPFLILASADKSIRYWRGDKLLRIFNKHTDVVRALCEIPGIGFASAGNDAYNVPLQD